MNFFKRFKRAIGIWMHYYVRPNPSDFGYFGKDTQIGVPTDLKNPKNVFLHDLVRIGPRSTFITVGNSKFVMKRGCLSAEGLTVITSNHRQKIGQFLSGGNEDNEYKDVIVDEDVWFGINVTLLPGVHVGRGAVVGAQSVVTKNIPPYCIAVGNPAKVIKVKWSVDQILEHEKHLYPESERFTRRQLQEFRACYEQISE